MIRGSATTDEQFAYFTPAGSFLAYRYEWSREKWEELPSFPYTNPGLVIIDGKLTAVAGWCESGCTKTLFTLRQRKWIEEYSPMNTACSSPSVVSTSDGAYITVIGWYSRDGWATAAAQLFKVKSRIRYKLADLPQPLPHPSDTIWGDQLSVIDDVNVLFKLYQPMINQSRHLSPYPGNTFLLYQWHSQQLPLSVGT